jgi:hypothetical protein
VSPRRARSTYIPPQVEAWTHHTTICKRCSLINKARPATYGGTCLEGAQLLKAMLAWAHDAALKQIHEMHSSSTHREPAP